MVRAHGGKNIWESVNQNRMNGVQMRMEKSIETESSSTTVEKISNFKNIETG